MFSPEKQEWIDARIKEHQESLKEEFWRIADPTVPVIDAGTFAKPLAEVTRIVTNKVERDGQVTFPNSTVPIDVGVILRQLHETYNLISWVNADDIRFGVVGYRTPYSFVILPLVRTMIDGFYNATAMLDDPVRARKFRISGHYRKRESLQADEARYGADPEWQADFSHRRTAIAAGMRAEQITTEDLDNRNNRWPGAPGPFVRTWEGCVPRFQGLRKNGEGEENRRKKIPQGLKPSSVLAYLRHD